jgi:hypothetical protein
MKREMFVSKYVTPSVDSLSVIEIPPETANPVNLASHHQHYGDGESESVISEIYYQKIKNRSKSVNPSDRIEEYLSKGVVLDDRPKRVLICFIRNCWTEMLARSLGHIIILVHFRSKR